jgi:hypothetical protein
LGQRQHDLFAVHPFQEAVGGMSHRRDENLLVIRLVVEPFLDVLVDGRAYRMEALEAQVLRIGPLRHGLGILRGLGLGECRSQPALLSGRKRWLSGLDPLRRERHRTSQKR